MDARLSQYRKACVHTAGEKRQQPVKKVRGGGLYEPGMNKRFRCGSRDLREVGVWKTSERAAQ